MKIYVKYAIGLAVVFGAAAAVTALPIEDGRGKIFGSFHSLNVGSLAALAELRASGFDSDEAVSDGGEDKDFNFKGNCNKGAASFYFLWEKRRKGSTQDAKLIL